MSLSAVKKTQRLNNGIAKTRQARPAQTYNMGLRKKIATMTKNIMSCGFTVMLDEYKELSK